MDEGLGIEVELTDACKSLKSDMVYKGLTIEEKVTEKGTSL